MKKIAYIATIPAVIDAFLSGHIRTAARQWSVKLISHPQGAELLSHLDAEFIPLAFERKMSPWRDLVTLCQLVAVFRREHFDLVHTIMPKTALLGMLAACLARVPHRIHTFTGQVWATRSGWKRWLLKLIDRSIVTLASEVMIDSPSQRDFLIREGVLPVGKGIVIGRGSICGIDERRFHPDVACRAKMREQLNIAPSDRVILFLGRLNRDKGTLELAQAFKDVASRREDVVLVWVGAEEEVSFERLQALCVENKHRMRKVSYTTTPEHYMAMADIFCLPSHREGFGQVIIEAGATGLPTVASRIYGITDAIEDGVTGWLTPVGDVPALVEALLRLIDDPDLCATMGHAARQRASNLFASETITEGWLALYQKLLS